MPEPVLPAPPRLDAGDAVLTFCCEGCGVHVAAFGITQAPRHGLCSVCAWLCEEVPDLEDMMRLRRLLGHQAQTETGEASSHGRLG